MSAQRVLVTGANGFVGTALQQALALSGRVFVRVATRTPPLTRSADVEQVIVPDVGPGTTWDAALAGCDTVVHLAARVHVMHDTAAAPLAEFRRVNTQGTVHLARQAARLGVRRFIYVSSVKVNGESTAAKHPFLDVDQPAPSDPYGISKAEAECALWSLASDIRADPGAGGMDVVVVRPPLVYGPGVKGNFLSLLKLIDRGIPLPLGSVHNLRSFVSVANLVDLLMVCVDHPQAANRTFLVSDGADLSTPALIEKIAFALDRRARLVAVPVACLRFGARLLGKADIAERLCGNLQVDISNTQATLGWAPPVPADAGLAQMAMAYRRANSARRQ